MKTTIWRWGWVLSSGLVACAHSEVSAQREELRRWKPLADATADENGARRLAARSQVLEGDLADFVAMALRGSPELAARYHRWQAEVEAVPTASRLPNPELGYGAFLEAVETRVGPQQHRLSLRQSIPWPGRLDADADAQAQRAAAEAEAFQVGVLDLARDVASAYWRAWEVERSHHIRLEHEDLLERLIQTVQARVETGEKPVAELLQVQLRLQYLRDHRIRHASEARQVGAELAALVGAAPGARTVVRTSPPAEALPALSVDDLARRALQHPEVARWSELVEEGEARARGARQRWWPSFTVGADYIVTGEAPVPGVEDSGKDPVIVALGLSLPVWVGADAAAARAAESRVAGARANARSAELRVLAQLEAVVARIEETHDRIRRYSGSLIPSAEALFETAIAAYEVGRAGVSELLLALEDELELRLELSRARAQHAIAWAELDRLTGEMLELPGGAS